MRNIEREIGYMRTLPSLLPGLCVVGVDGGPLRVKLSLGVEVRVRLGDLEVQSRVRVVMLQEGGHNVGVGQTRGYMRRDS